MGNPGRIGAALELIWSDDDVRRAARVAYRFFLSAMSSLSVSPFWGEMLYCDWTAV
jgi:hypothetical protein